MRKLFFGLVCLFSLSILMSSCKDECCSYDGGDEVCEDDFPSTFGSWSTYKASLKAAGYDCD